VEHRLCTDSRERERAAIVRQAAQADAGDRVGRAARDAEQMVRDLAAVPLGVAACAEVDAARVVTPFRVARSTVAWNEPVSVPSKCPSIVETTRVVPSGSDGSVVV
jgi:hypothetical protein